MKPTHNIVFAEKYTNREGAEKKKYTTIGTVFTRDDGSMAIKMGFVPVGENAQNWNGFLNVYPIDRERHNNQGQGGGHQNRGDDVVVDDIDDKPIDLSEIPF